MIFPVSEPRFFTGGQRSLRVGLTQNPESVEQTHHCQNYQPRKGQGEVFLGLPRLIFTSYTLHSCQGLSVAKLNRDQLAKRPGPCFAEIVPLCAEQDRESREVHVQTTDPWVGKPWAESELFHTWEIRKQLRVTQKQLGFLCLCWQCQCQMTSA